MIAADAESSAMQTSRRSPCRGRRRRASENRCRGIHDPPVVLPARLACVPRGGGRYDRGRNGAIVVAALLCLLLVETLLILPRASAFQRPTSSGISRLPWSVQVGLPHSPSNRRRQLLSQLAARGGTAATRKSTGWYPKTVMYDDDIFSEDDPTADLEQRIVLLAANLIRHRLSFNETDADYTPSAGALTDDMKRRTRNLVKDRYMDLTCSRAGEEALERLFYEDDQVTADMWDAAKEIAALTDIAKDDVIRGAIMVLQSLCIMGTQVGVKGPPEQLRRMVEHLADDSGSGNPLDLGMWNHDSVRRLKYKLDRTSALQLLTELRRKKTPQSAFDLLVALGAWEKHEDLALLRSGFPIRFTEAEEQAAEEAIRKVKEGRERADVDAILGLRQDLRHLKVYTIDGPSTAEIDDGVSAEKFAGDGNGKTRYRFWVHIADAERYAPPDSELFEAARRRITSLYLPGGSISMFPTRVGAELMSLKANQDVLALSLGVELHEDGSIDESSLIVTPSLIRVSYRLTYDDVDEMLEEGIGYCEEWELGALLMAATKRREFRIRNGSSEGMVPNPVPSASVSIYSDNTAPDSIGILVNVEVSHNAAKNKTATAEDGTGSSSMSVLEQPVSSAYLLVTEAMIMAGEAIGRWKSKVDSEAKSLAHEPGHNNCLRLPFRTQRPPGKRR